MFCQVFPTLAKLKNFCYNERSYFLNAGTLQLEGFCHDYGKVQTLPAVRKMSLSISNQVILRKTAAEPFRCPQDNNGRTRDSDCGTRIQRHVGTLWNSFIIKIFRRYSRVTFLNLSDRLVDINISFLKLTEEINRYGTYCRCRFTQRKEN